MSIGLTIEQRVEAVLEKAIDAVRDEFRNELLKLKEELTIVKPEVEKVESTVETDASNVVTGAETEVEKL